MKKLRCDVRACRARARVERNVKQSSLPFPPALKERRCAAVFCEFWHTTPTLDTKEGAGWLWFGFFFPPFVGPYPFVACSCTVNGVTHRSRSIG